MQIRNVNLNVQIKGTGTPFLWAHGLLSSIEAEDTLDWFKWGEFSEEIKLVRYDARGHGKSQPSYHPADYHWWDLGKDMLTIAEAVGGKPFIAGGDSMGCATSICAAVQQPDQVKGLVLVIPPTAWETRAAQGKLWLRFAIIGGLLGGKGMSRMMAGNMDRMMPGWMIQAEPAKLTGMEQGLSALKGRTLWNVMRGAAKTNLPPRQELAALVDIPTLILAWVGDPTHPVSSAEELHRLLPQSQFFIAQGYEDFKTISGRIREFVTKIV
jgi:3-oxoadipate enol-lactonase